MLAAEVRPAPSLEAHAHLFGVQQVTPAQWFSRRRPASFLVYVAGRVLYDALEDAGLAWCRRPVDARDRARAVAYLTACTNGTEPLPVAVALELVGLDADVVVPALRRRLASRPSEPRQSLASLQELRLLSFKLAFGQHPILAKLIEFLEAGVEVTGALLRHAHVDGRILGRIEVALSAERIDVTAHKPDKEGFHDGWSTIERVVEVVDEVLRCLMLLDFVRAADSINDLVLGHTHVDP